MSSRLAVHMLEARRVAWMNRVAAGFAVVAARRAVYAKRKDGPVLKYENDDKQGFCTSFPSIPTRCAILEERKNC